MAKPTSKTTRGVPSSGNTPAPTQKRAHASEHAPAEKRNDNQNYKF